MTWLTLAVRFSGFAILLPLVLANFPAAEVSVWLLFSSIAGFQLIADFGFGPTFSREISYGFAGHSLAELHTPQAIQPPSAAVTVANPNWGAIVSATAAMLWLYRRIALVFLLLLAVLGTWAVMGPIGRVVQPQTAWIAWVAVALTSAASIYGNAYASFLIGANRIELQQRWEAVVSGISILAQSGAVLFKTGLLGLVLVAQLALVVQIIVNRSLAFHVSDGLFGNADQSKPNQRLLRAMWPSVWRTAIGAIMSFGIAQVIAIVMANLLVAAEAASVQLALRIMQIISQISQVPFYTKIPELTRFRVCKKITLLAVTAAKSMRTSLCLYMVGAAMVDLVISHLLAQISSQTQFPDHFFWLLLTLAGLTERFGAMHIQLLLTSNKAIAHVANGVTGTLWLVGLFILFPIMGAVALPLSMLIAYAGFYAWTAVVPAHRSMPGVSLWRFEMEVVNIPLILTIAWVAYVILIRN